MQKNIIDWFFMRDGFDGFVLRPEEHAKYVFGEKEREYRDIFYRALEEAGYGNAGYRAAAYGDFGLGKTHQCHSLIYEIEKNGLPYVPVFVKCPSFDKKEPRNSLVREMVFNLPQERLRKAFEEYRTRVDNGTEKPLEQVLVSSDIARIMDNLRLPGKKPMAYILQYLAGEPKVDLTNFQDNPPLKDQLSRGADFADVMKGLGHVFYQVEGKLPLYLIDECEYLKNITDNDTFFGWVSILRELTEVRQMAMIFMVGAKNREDLPTLLVQPEISRRVGIPNYVEFVNTDTAGVRTFLLEQLQTSIRKGPVPEVHRPHVSEEAAADETIDPELLAITGGDPEQLECFPFEPEAFEQFVESIGTGGDDSGLASAVNTPAEAQDRLQKCATRAISRNLKRITREIVDELSALG